VKLVSGRQFVPRNRRSPEVAPPLISGLASIGDLLVRIDGDELSLSPVLTEKMKKDA
jgi:hypothetical protein